MLYRALCLCALLLYVCYPARGQQHAIDSLQQLIAKAPSPAWKAELMITLAKSYGLAGKDKALATLAEARRITRSAKDDSTEIEVLIGYAELYAGESADSSIRYAREAAARAKAGHYTEKEGRSENLVGNGYIARLQFADAQQHYLTAIHLYEKTGDKVAVGNLKVNFGYLFQQRRDTTTALRYYREASAIFMELKAEDRLAQIYNNFGILYGESGDLDASLRYFLLSTELREKLHRDKELPDNYMNLGSVYLLQKDFANAEKYMNKALDIFTRRGNDRGIADCQSNLGVLEENRGNYKGAIAYYEKALALSRSAADYDNIENLTVNISNAWERMGNYRMAYHWDEQLLALKDTIYERQQIKSMAEMQTKYEAAEKEKKIALLHNQAIIQHNAIQRRNILLAVGALLFLFFGMAAYQYYRRYKLRQETALQEEIIHQQDLASKGIIEAEERERKRIAGDLHDGIGQLFSAVKMNMNNMSSHISFEDPQAEQAFEKTLAMVDESCREVRSISHQMMPNTLLKFGLASAVRDFINKIDTRQLRVNLDIHGLNERLDANIETVLYRVLQETVNNVIKHAGATQLDIQLSKEEGAITAMIEDNGKGFDLKTMEQAEGIGVRNIRTRIGYLKGTVEFDSTPGRGTVVSVWVPINES